MIEKRTVEFEFSRTDLADLLITTIEAKHPELQVKSVYFDIVGQDREDDWRAEYPLDYVLSKAIVTAVPK